MHVSNIGYSFRTPITDKIKQLMETRIKTPWCDDLYFYMLLNNSFRKMYDGDESLKISKQSNYIKNMQLTIRLETDNWRFSLKIKLKKYL